jgi:hypothetical protein
MDNANLRPSESETTTALFGGMVIQLSQTALMLLGKVPPPDGSEPARDLEAAGFFIGQLEMLEAKTKGNLNPDEQRLLAQSLMAVRMAFVESVNAKPAPAPAPSSPEPGTEPPSPSATPATAQDAVAPAADDSDSRKRYSKKY